MFKKNRFRSVILTRGIILYVCSLPIVAFVGFFVAEFFRDPFIGIEPSAPETVYTIFACVEGVATIIAGWILNLWIGRPDDQAIEYLASEMGPTWEERIKDKRPMSVHTARFIAIILIFIALLSVLLCYLFTNYLKGIDLCGFNVLEVNDYLIPSIVIALLVPIAPISVIRFFDAWEYIRFGYCHKCGAVFGYTYDRFLGTEHTSGTRTKTVRKNEYTGTYYEGYTQVDVYADVDHNYSQNYNYSTSKHGCHCGFCGESTYLLQHGHYSQSDWTETK